MKIEKASGRIFCGENVLSAVNLQRLISGEITALCVPSYYHIEESFDLSARIQASPSFGSYTYIDVVSRIGMAWQEAVKGNEQTKNAYFSSVREHFLEIRQVFGGLSPLDKFRLDMEEIWPQGANIMRYQNMLMFAGIVRFYEPGSYALPHQDVIPEGMNIDAQIGMNVYLNPASDGGALELWDLGLNAPDYDAIRLNGSFGLDRTKLPAPDSIINPEAGDLILFDVRKLHAVNTINSGVRISQGAFIGCKNGNPLKFWS
jgi:hypothetical protein